MPRLFVDVDDTLVRWKGAYEPHPYGFGAEGWEPNLDVIRYIRDWKATNPDGQVFIWSGGGREYAATWRDTLIPGLHTTTMSKIPSFTQPGDTIIDDQNLQGFAGRVLHPAELAS